jgi:hypothetical protein
MSICDAMTALHRLASFVARVFDRRRDDSVNNVRDDDKSALPPFTFEAYAEGLSNLLQLFSADLLQVENTVQVIFLKRTTVKHIILCFQMFRLTEH